jgi:hypothetical protein
VVELVRVHRPDHAELVSDSAKMRERVAEPDAAFSALLELPPRAEELGRARRESESLPFEELIGAVLTVPAHELGLVVVEVQMRRGSGQVQVDHPPRARSEVRRARVQGIRGA